MVRHSRINRPLQWGIIAPPFSLLDVKVAVWIPEGVPVVQGQIAGPGGLEFDVQRSFPREPDNRIVQASSSLGPVAVRITLLRAFD